MHVGAADRFFATVFDALRAAVITDGDGLQRPCEALARWFHERAATTVERGGKLVFIGNGGSAGVASHMAIDYGKNGGLRALAFNDGAALTCLGNDLGYDQVFAKQIEMHGATGDILIAISSSGRSPNILNAVEEARERGLTILTLSGFGPDNPLRKLGDFNVYIGQESYGCVEIAHLSILHFILDSFMAPDG